MKNNPQASPPVLNPTAPTKGRSFRSKILLACAVGLALVALTGFLLVGFLMYVAWTLP